MRAFSRSGSIGLSIIFLSLFITAAVTGDEKLTPGPEVLYRLDRLAEFKESVEVGSISSYDRTGGNNDGFGGEYSFVRKEGDGLVLAELTGPGVIYRIWTPTPTEQRPPAAEPMDHLSQEH